MKTANNHVILPWKEEIKELWARDQKHPAPLTVSN